MPFSDTETTPDGSMDLVLKGHHQPSNSEIGRLTIPMYVFRAIKH
jgi:hypothetical protein